ncbi:MAG: peptidase T [Bacteroidales bacterium]|nr:peptidase T [Bacteroidales bacterium]
MLNPNSISERFIRYAKIETQSDNKSVSCPSSSGQIDLARLLLIDLEEVGCTEISLDRNGYIMATLPANVSKYVPTIGFIAHLDTSPDYSGKNVQPRLVHAYSGSNIPLDPASLVSLSPVEFPELLNYIGQDLLVTDGSTLLGADDKAGITEILEAIVYLNRHPEIPHGKIRIGFTPDEEIGRGADLFDVKKFGAEFAYTVDGGPIGELEYENFNAAAVAFHIQGRNVHPGTAKGKMINALQVAIDLHSMLPVHDRPEKTDGYEGFFHLSRIEGTVEKARMDYIIRDHDFDRFTERKNMLVHLAAQLNKKYSAGTVKASVRDQYYNMKEKILPVYHIVELAAQAMKMAGVEPLIIPIRGGTDGSKLSFMGLPTPNLFTGGHNYHGRFEFIPVQSMKKATEVIINIARIAAS